MGALRLWRVVRVWGVLCLMACMGASPHLNQVDYTDFYDNEVSREQHEEDSMQPQTSCQSAELTRWDKLFIALENAHMRQNMLLESSESCCGAVASLRAQLDHLARTASRQCPPWQSALKALRQEILELREEGEARERRFNATLRTLPLKEQEVVQEVTSPPVGSLEKVLVAIATEMQRLRTQLGLVIQQTGTQSEDRGDS